MDAIQAACKKYSILLFGILLVFGKIFGQANKPNILWITCEDISPAWGCYGDAQATTPNIDAIAEKGYRFNQAFSNAPICAPARSTLITGIYATSMGTQNLRSEIPIPDDLKILPELLREVGYFTSNNAKTDYNFSAVGRWNDLGNQAHWRNREGSDPFFSVFNFGITHEGHANSNDPEDTRSLAAKHDPNKMIIPPYYPDNEEFRKIMAHQYDLISVFDQEVGKLISALESDGLDQETIIFIFSDHGFGLPRYKRWLYDTGLRVPFVLYVPERYRKLIPELKSPVVDHLVAFIDFAPTVLHLAGAAIPARMQGHDFLGEPDQKDLVFGYRDRADDVYDMSRSVYDGRYLFIRHFMPQNPYIQEAIIFNREKTSFNELRRLRGLGALPPESIKMFHPKPVEELYDLLNDPEELHNLIDYSDHTELIGKLREDLFSHMVTTFDSGLMNEADMMSRAIDHHSVYEAVRQPELFNPGGALEAAEIVGKIASPSEVVDYLSHEDAPVRYWALVALDAYQGDLLDYEPYLEQAAQDSSPANRVLAAQILINKLAEDHFLKILEDALDIADEPSLLQVVIAIRNIGPKAKPLLPKIVNEVYPQISGEIWGKYKNWSYPMFIGMALDQIKENCSL